MKKERLEVKLNYKGRKSIPGYLLSLYFLLLIIVFIRQEPVTSVRSLHALGYLLIWLGITLFSMLEISAVRRCFQAYALGLNGLFLAIMPVLSFLMVEIMVSNYNLHMFRSYSLYNLIWYIVICYMIHALIRNSKYTMILGGLIIYLMALVNYFVYLFRGNPLIPSDLLAWQTGMSVASNYTVSITEGVLVATLLMYLIYVLACKLEKPKKKPSLLNRILVTGSFLVTASVVYGIFFNTDLVEAKIRVLDFFAPKYTYMTYGTAFSFVANVKAMGTEEPEGYSIDKVEALLQNAAYEAGGEEKTSGKKPNIIVIMNEAYSDLSLVGNFETNMDYRPFTRTLEDNTTQGTMYVSVFGGATSDTEYEFLTGNSMAVLPKNCVPYQQYVTDPTDSLAKTLKDQGYYNIAIHPYEASGYKRDLVYPLLGFDEFLSMEDFKEPEFIRSYISDRSSFQKVIEEYEAKGKDQPLFIFNVTMQDHGGYTSEQLFSEEESVRLTGMPGFGAVEQYLSLQRQSDMAFQVLTDYFSKQEEPTIILMFGDHQPVAFSTFYDSGASKPEEYRQKYAVPFILWANYDISEDDVDNISANYLSTYLLKVAGLKDTAYNEYLWQLYQRVPVINGLFYIDKNNGIYSLGEASGYSELVREYQYVGYNNALDKDRKLSEYFYLRE
ncbi:MAG TPA: LTA synthase family protein [Clostridiales bacterium]|nr:LTA synthase family protein [Clostridiales bacterium]